MLLLLLSSLLTFSADAETSIRSIHTLVLTPIQDLRKNGFEKIGNINLSELEDQLKQVTYKKFVRDERYAVSDKMRTSALYSTTQKAVYRYPGTQDELIDQTQASAFYLHESLGALGYRDERYELSMSLIQLAQSPKLQEPLINILKSATQNPAPITYTQDTSDYLASEGGSVVGGGGDAASVFIKMMLTKESIIPSLLHLADAEKLGCSTDPSIIINRALLASIETLSFSAHAPCLFLPFENDPIKSRIVCEKEIFFPRGNSQKRVSALVAIVKYLACLK